MSYQQRYLFQQVQQDLEQKMVFIGQTKADFECNDS